MMSDLANIKEFMSLQQDAYKDATSLLFNSLNKRIEDQNDIIFELRRSLEYSQNELQSVKTDLSDCKNQLKQKSDLLNDNQLQINGLQQQVANIEDYSRKKNVRIEGIMEIKQENWEQTQSRIQKLFDKKMELENVKVDFAHRISNGGGSGPRTIIAKLNHDTDREKVLKSSWKLKGTQIFINEDLSEHTLQKRKEKFPDLKKARQAGKIAYFIKDRLIIRERNGNIGVSDRKFDSKKTPLRLGTLNVSCENLAPCTPPVIRSKASINISSPGNTTAVNSDLPVLLNDSNVAARRKNKSRDNKN